MICNTDSLDRYFIFQLISQLFSELLPKRPEPEKDWGPMTEDWENQHIIAFDL